jgi:hypothetical protein
VSEVITVSNHELVGRALELLKKGLAPFIEREFQGAYRERAEHEANRFLRNDRLNTKGPLSGWDSAALLKLMWEAWNSVFCNRLGRAERNLISELRECRNKWAHQESFSGEDAYRVLDSAARLLAAISAPQVDEIERIKSDLRRQLVEVHSNSQRPAASGAASDSRRSSPAIPTAKSGAVPDLIEHPEALAPQALVNKRVLCPGCRQKVFVKWPMGWDAHAAHGCSGLNGTDPHQRKNDYRTRFSRLFR